MVWIRDMFLLMLYTNIVSPDFTCFIELSPDPLHACELRWALLIDKDERCTCTRVFAKSQHLDLPCYSQPTCNDSTHIWFTETPGRLTDRRVWNAEKLKYLLGCTYIDGDECNPNQCQHGATCIDELFDFRCLCADGYEGDTCQTDIDECTTNAHSCDVNAACTNTDGSYTCACNGGYNGDGNTCQDIDECTTNSHSCDVNAACSNTDGSYTCACNGGYNGDGIICEDIDECVTGADNCDANAQCSNTVGSFTCACNSGYDGDGTTCIDIDECTTINAHSCDVNAACTNTDGSYSCACNDGYNGDGSTCEDIDECTTNSHSCDVNAACTNTVGSYSCACNDGYNGNGITCQVCDDYMGVANYEIPDANMQASSAFQSRSADKGRLNSNFYWEASEDEIEPWIQADIGYQTFISGVVTQGDGETGEYADWITSFKVSTFTSSGSAEQYVMNGNQVMIFPGNMDTSNAKESYFLEPVNAQIVRIRCLVNGGGLSPTYYAMRFEILGCKRTFSDFSND